MTWKRKAGIAAAAIALKLVILAILLHSWGLWRYLAFTSGPVTPSPNSRKRAGNLLFKAHPRGEALLLHGLNFDADKMMPLAFVFHELGYQVRVPRLYGHQGALEETFEDALGPWNQQFFEWNRDLQGAGRICSGFSLGGLLVVEKFLEGRLHCEKFVLFAPAFATYTPAFVARALQFILPKKLTVPTAIPGDYKHFDHLGLGPSYATMKIQSQFQATLASVADRTVPNALVFLDPLDQVVDSAATKRIIERYFPRWKVVDVLSNSIDEGPAHHLIVDELHVGAQGWRQIQDELAAFLRQ